MNPAMNAAFPDPSIGRTLAWELWRLGRVRLLSILAGVAALVSLIYSVAPPADPGDEPTFFYGLFWVTLICFVIVVVQCRDDPSSKPAFEPRLFRLPVPTPVLVGWRMALLTTVVVLMYVAVALLVSGLFGFSWPIWGPALVAMAAMAWTLALAWMPVEFPLLRSLAGGLGVWGLVLWTGARFGAEGSERPTRMWTVPTPVELLTLGALIAVAYAVAVVGVTRDRCGETVTIPGLRTAWADLVRRTRRLVRQRRTVLGSARRAQLWLEWRQKGWIMPAYAAGGLLIVVLMQGFDGFETGAILRSLIPMTTFIVWAFPPVIGAIMGRFSVVSHEPGLDLFRATRPLGDGALANVLLRTGALSLVASWTVTAAGASAIVGTLYQFGDREQMRAAWTGLATTVRHLGYGPSLVVVALVVLVSWMSMGLVTSLFLTGRNWMAEIFAGIPAVLAVGYVLLQELIPASLVLAAMQWAPWCAGTVGLFGTAVAFVAARRRRLIDRRRPWIALGIWLGLVAGGAIYRWDILAELVGSGLALERSLVLLGLGGSALVTAPVALAPLALSWNRHR